MTSYAAIERRLFADQLLERGPDAPTLCAGWTTRDLAAHIVVRDRRPDSALGMILPPLRRYGENIRLRKAAEPYRTVAHEVRHPPVWSPVSNPLVERVTNTAEFFIHHEDVRRTADGWQPRELDPELEQALWKGARIPARFGLRRLGVTARVRAEGLGEFTTGENPQVTIAGRAGELTLFLSGRQGASRVEITGDPAAVARVREGRLGF